MPQAAWNPKRERQYKHIKQSLKQRGASTDKAEEIAARTVNKERARSGESRTASKTSTRDISSGRCGRMRAQAAGPGTSSMPRRRSGASILSMRLCPVARPGRRTASSP